MRKSFIILSIVATVVCLSFARKMSDDDHLRYQYFATEGMRQRHQGNVSASIDLFRHALDINPDADDLLFALASYYEGTDDSLFLDYLQRAIAINPSNEVYLNTLAYHYIKKENYADAITILEQQSRNGTNKDKTLDILATLYVATKQYDKALDALDRLETKVGKNMNTTLRKIQIYEEEDDTTATYRAFKSIVDENDDEASYKTMFGNWLIQKGYDSEARQYLESATRQAPDDYSALMSLYDYYNRVDQDSLAQMIANRVLRSPNTPVKDRSRFMGNCVRTIYNSSEQGDTAAAFAFCNKLLKENPSDSIAAYFRVSLMQSFGYPNDSILQAMDTYFSIVPDDPDMRLQQAQLYATIPDWQRIDSVTTIGLQYNPDELVFYYFNALSKVQRDNDDGAISVLQHGLRSRGEGTNNELVADCFAVLADMQSGKNNMGQAFQMYDSCLVYKPDHISSLNNYAYYLSLANRDLKKAELMSYQTVMEEPNNDTYLDTYAWILFQQGRYDDAQTYIDRTLEIMKKEAKEGLKSQPTISDSIIAVGSLRLVPDGEDDNVAIDSVGEVDTVGVDTVMPNDTTIYEPTDNEVMTALTSVSSNSTIFEHAGDISYMNGHIDNALRYWNDAAACASPDKTLRKKIKNKKYFPRKAVKP